MESEMLSYLGFVVRLPLVKVATHFTLNDLLLGLDFVLDLAAVP